jgi:putative sigma-54 modulation protein
LYQAIDKAVDKLEDQIRRQKTRLSRKNRASALSEAFLDAASEEEDAEEEIVKTKSIVPAEMSLDEAIAHMELLDHDFYIYTDDETKKIAVVYCREEGGYGLIETE